MVGSAILARDRNDAWCQCSIEVGTLPLVTLCEGSVYYKASFHVENSCLSLWIPTLKKMVASGPGFELNHQNAKGVGFPVTGKTYLKSVVELTTLGSG